MHEVCFSCCLLAVVTRFDYVWWKIHIGDVETDVLCIQILHRKKVQVVLDQ